jgi:4-amino-4-deoxy-L-arabinose transferase-like glycosyltransferase
MPEEQLTQEQRFRQLMKQSKADPRSDTASFTEKVIVFFGSPVFLLLSIPARHLHEWWVPFVPAVAGMISPIYALSVGLIALGQQRKKRAAFMINVFLIWVLVLIVAYYIFNQLARRQAPLS